MSAHPLFQQILDAHGHLDRAYADADAELVERTRALTAESVAKLNEAIDALFAARPRLVVGGEQEGKE